MNNSLELGGIYKTKWDKRPLKILLFDEIEVFYDCFWEESGWGFKDAKKATYYRTSASIFRNDSKKIGIEPLSDQEHSLYRPDLPLRICRTIKFDWQKNELKEVEDLSQFNALEEFFSVGILPVKELAIKPHDLKGKLKKGKIIKTLENGFKYMELIYHANNINAPYFTESNTGIGLYRIGVEKGIPSYYIGSHYDQAGIIKYYEDNIKQ